MILSNLIAASSFSPNLLPAPSAWIGHLPFSCWVIREVSPKIFVELGTHYGHSYFSFCQAVAEANISTKCYAVDTWQGDDHVGRYGDDIFNQVNEYHQAEYSEFSCLLRMTFDAASDYFADGSIDLLHIDGCHSYDVVKHDFETWLPKLAAGAVVLFHDTNVREREFGVWKLWEELQDQYPLNIEFAHSHGLGVLQLANGAAEKQLYWLHHDSGEQQILKNYFSALGTRQAERYEMADIRKAMADLDRRLTEQNQAMADREGEISELNQTVADRDRQAAELNQSVADRDGQITKLNQAVADRDGQITELNQAVADRDGQITELNQAVADHDGQIAMLLNSRSWRLTALLRTIGHQYRVVRDLWIMMPQIIVKNGGFKHTFLKALKIIRQEGLKGIRRGCKVVEISQGLCPEEYIDSNYQKVVSLSAVDLFAPRVLIVAEMSLPQCKKYRVNQKFEMIQLLGIDCTILNWNDTQKCLDALQVHSLVIFYRVPAYQGVLAIIDEAKRLMLPTIWEVDDLIFDRNVLIKSKTVAALDKITFDQLLEGADLYLNAMLLCDKGIASTTGLAYAMSKFGMPEVYVIENALDQQTLQMAEKALSEHANHQNDIVRIVYGSGTTTHNIDFQEAAPAIIKILHNFPNVRFRLIGMLDLPERFSYYEDQIERIPFCNYEEYLSALSECDISIAPLENYIFNDSKSNIKFLEASIVRLPSVCSPRAAFSHVIIHDENGFLCETDEEWETALTVLVTDKTKRIHVGEAAYLSVTNQYTPERIAQQQVAPLFERFNRRIAPLRVLSVNCLYNPRSFGGATIVAEEVNKLLNAQEEVEVHVFTTLPSSVVDPYKIRRYEADNINIYGVGMPDKLEEKEEFENVNMVNAFSDVLAVVHPDIVHFHSIQGIGVSVVDLCAQKGIKYIITLHDAWWLCGRQFMVNKQHKYCEQKKINLNLCANCVENNDINLYRNDRLRSALLNSSVLLAPSRYFAEFYNANEVYNVQVNKNGIVKPSTQQRFHHEGNLRFGYVGGNTEIKGFHLVKKVFSDLAGYNVSLVLVDNALNLGYSSYHQQDVQSIPNAKVVPAYTQRNMDEFFAGIDVLFFPTQAIESFGLTVREALARNVWVITTDAGGVVEDIKPGRNGYIVPFLDTGEGLKQAVVDTLKHFESIRFGEEVSLGALEITFFEDQAAELASILKKVVQIQS